METPQHRSANLYSYLNSRCLTGTGPRPVWRSPTLLFRFHLAKRLERHAGCVNTIVWSSDGTRLLSGSDDCCVCIWSAWDVANAKLLATIDSGHRRNIFCAKFRPDSPGLVTCALDRQVRLLDVESQTSTVLASLPQFASKFEWLPGSADVFYIAAQDGHVSRFDLREGRDHEAVIDLTDVGGCTTLAFDPTSSGQLFAVGCDDPLVRLYDVRRLGNVESPSSTPSRPLLAFAHPLHLTSGPSGRFH